MPAWRLKRAGRVILQEVSRTEPFVIKLAVFRATFFSRFRDAGEGDLKEFKEIEIRLAKLGTLLQ